MNRQQIDLLRQSAEFKDAVLVETHISFLLFTPDKVYKMKKDIQFSFLDFSTRSSRKFYCEHELMLNRRLAPGLYEGVIAINPSQKGLEPGPYREDSIDYAIKMRRVDKKWEMDGMLARGEVSFKHIDLLAGQLAAFHQNADLDNSLFNPIKALDLFSDIGNYSRVFIPHIGAVKMDEIMVGLSAVRSFLRTHHQRFHDRRMLGFTVDGHGDLHTGNVFLEEGKPLIFDCIEFNDEFRKIDVLDEIAFMYVDLEAGGRHDLAERFATSYHASNPTLLLKEDAWLFNYYKCYRANIRLKTTAIKIGGLPSEAHADELLDLLHRYLDLYLRYIEKLNEYEKGAK
jgi:aminoglycoside phosphotransferase family enzyme